MMAKRNVTLQSPSCKDNPATSPQEFHRSRQLTILEVVREQKPRSHRAVLEHHPVQLEPYTVLRGQWLAKAGFTIGQKITVQVSQNRLVITPSETPDAEL